MSDIRDGALERIRAAAESGAQKLDLSKLALTAVPDEISTLTELIGLDLSYNQLSELPEAISRLTNLMVLDLSHNQLTGVPEAISSLTNLSAIDLRGNQLDIPEEILERWQDAPSILRYLSENRSEAREEKPKARAISPVTFTGSFAQSQPAPEPTPPAPKRVATDMDEVLAINVPPLAFSQGAAEVLNAALQIRAQRKDRGASLTTSTLLFAFVEEGRRGKLGRTPEWIYQRIVPTKYDQLLTEYLKYPLALEQQRNYDVVKRELVNGTRSPNFVKLLSAAAKLAEQASQSHVIGARHLFVALLAHAPKLRVSNSWHRLEAMGIDLAATRADLHGYLKLLPHQDDSAVWGEALLGPPPAPQAERFSPGYSADDATGEDVLGLKDELAGFASVIASRDLVPPLSIGLFGAWGSGKSFFMRKLRGEIDALALGSKKAKEARQAREAKDPKAQKEPEERFCPDIVSIEFNAWHYAETSLWASLVDHILQSLEDYLGDKAGTNKKKVEAVFKKLNISKKNLVDAQQKLDSAKAGREKARTDLAQRSSEEQKRASSLKVLLSMDLWKEVLMEALPKDDQDLAKEAAKKLGFPDLARSAHELKNVVATARTTAGRTRLLASSIFLRPAHSFVLFLFTVSLPALIWVTQRWAHDSGQSITAAAGSISLFLTGVTAWLKHRVDTSSGVLDSLKHVDEVITTKLHEQETAHQTAITAAHDALEKAQASVAEADLQVVRAVDLVHDAEIELEQTRPERRMAKFVQDRVESDDYRKHLGLAATVRNDFEKLSQLMYPEKIAGIPELPESTEELARVDRIVLYIDDLDRCPPARVVEVLEAVHLLLAFKLFVVVVGVDSRWMTRALLHHYPKLLQEDGAAGAPAVEGGASPVDYLEKIFQIPFWVRSLSGEGAFQLIAGLLGPSTVAMPIVLPDAGKPQRDTELAAPEVGKTPAVPKAAPAEAVHPIASNKLAMAAPEATAPVAPLVRAAKQESVPLTPAAMPAPESASAPRPVVAARRLDTATFETEFMEALSPFIGRSPRRVKRFVNIYRIIKASLSARARANFIKERGASGDHQAVLVLLALVTGAPRLAQTLFHQLINAKRDARVNVIVDELRGAPVDDEHDNAIGALQCYLDTQGSEVSTDALTRWAPEVGRYSFFASRSGRSDQPGT